MKACQILATLSFSACRLYIYIHLLYIHFLAVILFIIHKLLFQKRRLIGNYGSGNSSHQRIIAIIAFVHMILFFIGWSSTSKIFFSLCFLLHIYFNWKHLKAFFFVIIANNNNHESDDDGDEDDGVELNRVGRM